MFREFLRNMTLFSAQHRTIAGDIIFNSRTRRRTVDKYFATANEWTEKRYKPYANGPLFVRRNFQKFSFF
jgi:hypothetical protein